MRQFFQPSSKFLRLMSHFRCRNRATSVDSYAVYIDWQWRNLWFMSAVLTAMCRSRKCKHFAELADRSPRWRAASTKLFLNPSIQFYLNKVSPWRDVTVLARRAVQCRPPDRPRTRRPARHPPVALQTTTDDRRQRAKQHWPIRRASNNVTVLHKLTSRSTTSCPGCLRAYNIEIVHGLQWRYFILSI